MPALPMLIRHAHTMTSHMLGIGDTHVCGCEHQHMQRCMQSDMHDHVAQLRCAHVIALFLSLLLQLMQAQQMVLWWKVAGLIYAHMYTYAYTVLCTCT